jgi:2-(1,2-epoxy-1,2-dihydrophenyl)acetyl-CoA isomerase
MPDFETIRLEVDGGLARLALDRPDRLNGMTNQMVREAHDAVAIAAADASIRVLVLTGEGRGFCPGADLGHFTDGDSDEVLAAEHFQIVTMLHEMPAVTVAAVNGACAGAGMGWALACDLRVMAASAKMNTAFLDVAVAGDMALPWLLPRLIGASKAREFSFLPGKVTAEEALRIGLVARVFPDETFRPAAEEVVSSLLAKSPTALRGLKQHYVDAERMPLAEFVEHESRRHLEIAASADTAEAFRAFIEKREPRFITP